MKVKVDEELCNGCGPCMDICPEVFELNGDAVRVKFDGVPPMFEEACREAADECPMHAILIEV